MNANRFRIRRVAGLRKERSMEMTAFQRRAAVALLSMAAATAMSTALAPAATADGYVGAIAYSRGGGMYGRAWDAPTKAAAVSAAMSACGYTDCQVLVTFTNCGAIAYDAAGDRQGGFGPTLGAAEQDALNRLGGGWIDTWACN
jgi:hypothetical protein